MSAVFRLTVFCVIYAGFLLITASLWYLIESDREIKIVEDYLESRRSFLAQHDCLSPEEMDKLVAIVSDAIKKGVSVRANRTYIPNWTYGGSLLFTVSLVTTIGFGDVAPSSDESKLFAMFIAMIGIPMTAVLLSAVSERWLSLIDSSGLLTLRWHESSGHQFRELMTNLWQIVVIVSAVAVLVICIPAVMLTRTEGWSLFHGMYFSLMALTTVGLGDLSLGDNDWWIYDSRRSTYKMIAAVYCIVGLTFVALVLDLSGRLPRAGLSVVLSAQQKRNPPLVPPPGMGDIDKTILSDNEDPALKQKVQLDIKRSNH